MKNKLFSVILAGAMLSGVAQVQAEANHPLGWLAGASVNIMGSAIILKAADGILSSINNNNTTNVILLGAATSVAQIALPIGAFLLYKNISGDKKPSDDTKVQFGVFTMVSAMMVSCALLDGLETMRGIALGGLAGNIAGSAINIGS